jgi:hypothetical protein
MGRTVKVCRVSGKVPKNQIEREGESRVCGGGSVARDAAPLQLVVRFDWEVCGGEAFGGGARRRRRRHRGGRRHVRSGGFQGPFRANNNNFRST